MGRAVFYADALWVEGVTPAFVQNLIFKARGLTYKFNGGHGGSYMPSRTMRLIHLPPGCSDKPLYDIIAAEIGEDNIEFSTKSEEGK